VKSNKPLISGWKCARSRKSLDEFAIRRVTALSSAKPMPPMIKLLANGWISAPLGAVVYLVATVLFWQKPVLPSPGRILADVVHAIGPSWDFNNPEADLLITELKLEKKRSRSASSNWNDWPRV
jgi:hypothetical protein